MRNPPPFAALRRFWRWMDVVEKVLEYCGKSSTHLWKMSYWEDMLSNASQLAVLKEHAALFGWEANQRVSVGYGVSAVRSIQVRPDRRHVDSSQARPMECPPSKTRGNRVVLSGNPVRHVKPKASWENSRKLQPPVEFLNPLKDIFTGESVFPSKPFRGHTSELVEARVLFER